MYLSAADEAVNAVLIRDHGTQVPIYYVSRALRGPETRYTQVEKLVLELVHATRQLKSYFLAHPISVRTDQPIRQILVRPEISGRLTKWAVELGEYDLSYKPRTTIKAQTLAYFLAEFTFSVSQDASLAPFGPQNWTLYVDGFSNSDGSGAGLLLEDPHGEVCLYTLRFDFFATNNETEYEALIAGLRLARKLGSRQIQVYSDSQLVASSFSALNKTVLVEMVTEPEYLEEVVCPVHSGDTWMSSLILFLGQGILPEDRVEAKRVQRKAARYALPDDELYKRSYFGQLLQCIPTDEGFCILKEIHESLCGAHIGYKMLAKKALFLGYYWPTVQQDAQDLVLSCLSCQVHASEHHQLTNLMVPITSP
nr:uncharacterized protein LOC113740770 [Coffea arabica]